MPGEPDEVLIALEVVALEPTPEGALDDVAGRSEMLEALLEELGVPRRARSTSGVSVGEEREWQQDRQVSLGFRARNRVVVKLPSASTVGTMMREATARAAVDIQGPWWRVALDNPFRTEACRQAAADARRKAQAYAEALGFRLGSVERVEEPGVRAHHAFEAGGATFTAGAMAAPTHQLEVGAGALDISAAVDVTFRLEAEYAFHSGCT